MFIFSCTFNSKLLCYITDSHFIASCGAASYAIDTVLSQNATTHSLHVLVGRWNIGFGGTFKILRESFVPCWNAKQTFRPLSWNGSLSKCTFLDWKEWVFDVWFMPLLFPSKVIWLLSYLAVKNIVKLMHLWERIGLEGTFWVINHRQKKPKPNPKHTQTN